MSILGLTAEEHRDLRVCLQHAVAGRCIPEWEFFALVGRTPAEVLLWIDAGLPSSGLDGETDDGLLDQVIAMLSMLAGSGHDWSTSSLGSRSRRRTSTLAVNVGREQLDRLLEKLCWSPDERSQRSPHQSAVRLRSHHPAAVALRAEEPATPARRVARKRPA